MSLVARIRTVDCRMGEPLDREVFLNKEVLAVALYIPVDRECMTATEVLREVFAWR